MAPPSLHMEKLTSPEIRSAIDAGMHTVIIPSGAMEQHGAHVTLQSDTLQAWAIAERVARRMSDALVAPPITVGCSDHHLSFSGTLSLRPETFVAIHLDYCRSLARHGFRRIACYSGHGGNFGALRDALPELRRAAAPANVSAFTDLQAYIGAWKAAVREGGYDVGQVGGHADLAESSIILALDPTLVRRGLEAPGFRGDTSEVIPRVLRDGLASVSPNGILGDPTGMNPALGEACIENVTSLLVEHFQDEASWAA
jgi:creatinine amidohydrolase